MEEAQPTMLPHDEGEADAARSQEEVARDDSAATMLQGSVRRRNAKQELSQRRQVRDDGAATICLLYTSPSPRDS